MCSVHCRAHSVHGLESVVFCGVHCGPCTVSITGSRLWVMQVELASKIQGSAGAKNAAFDNFGVCQRLGVARAKMLFNQLN